MAVKDILSYIVNIKYNYIFLRFQYFLTHFPCFSYFIRRILS